MAHIGSPPTGLPLAMRRDSPFDMFRWLPADVRDDFVSACRMRRLRPGEQIYDQGDRGDCMFRIVSGAVRLSTMRADGREFLYLLFEPGDCFGASSCIDEGPRPHQAEAADDTELQVLNRSAFDLLRSRHRAFDDALLRLMSGHMRLLSDFLADAHLADLPARVAGRLLSMARGFGVRGGDGVQLSIRLTQSELALMVGGARQSVNKVLQRLEEDGVVSNRGGRLIVHSLDELQRRAGQAAGEVA